MSSAGLVLGRRLALLVRLHQGSATLQELFDALQSRGLARTQGQAAVQISEAWRHAFYADLEALRALGYQIRFDRQADRYAWTNSPFMPAAKPAASSATAWQVFERGAGGYGRPDAPVVVIRGGGENSEPRIYLNMLAAALVGNYVCLLWDAQRKRVGLRSTQAGDPNAYVISRAGRGATIAAKRFVETYALASEQEYPAHLEDGVLVFVPDVRQPVSEAVRYPQRVVAEQLGVPAYRVANARIRLGLGRRRGRGWYYTENEIAQLRAEVGGGEHDK